MRRNTVRNLCEHDKREILERDGYICAYCLGDASELDHVIPWKWNHDDNENNWQQYT